MKINTRTIDANTYARFKYLSRLKCKYIINLNTKGLFCLNMYGDYFNSIAYNLLNVKKPYSIKVGNRKFK